jgi:hypothetical protein
MRVVVNLVGDAAHGQLAESRFVDRPFLYGGERNMYELAFAAAANGCDVELRGWLDRRVFYELAPDGEPAPRVELPSRLPSKDDVVIVPEGWRDPLEYARLLLSPARLALYVLAAPGLFGWPFCAPGWEPPDPLTVDLEELAQPVHFQAMHSLGFHLLTPSPGTKAAAEAAGVPCCLVGFGRRRPPTPTRGVTKTADAVGLLRNRWASFVQEVAAELDGLVVDLVEESPNHVVLERLERGKVLIWPSRVEGHATIPWEARSVGCVPVALSSNRFAIGLSEDKGAVVVDDIADIAPAIRQLLDDEPRWRELSNRGIRSAPQDAEWAPFQQRVGAFLESLEPAGPKQAALAGMGAALERWLQMRTDEAIELGAELERVRADRDAQHYDAAWLREDRDRLAAELAEMMAKRSVRMALRAQQLAHRNRS